MSYLNPKSETIISFSGGRTSGMMLKIMLDACGGKFPDHVKVVFCNTGEECEETLTFVNDCSIRWNVPIIWLEYKQAEKAKDRWHEVTYETASRNGEPFEALINQKKYLPNPVTRFCTIELKIRCAKRYAQSVLKWKNWDVAIGFRADEPDRVAKLSGKNKEPFERFAPLYHANVTAEDVGLFWKKQEFDLKLPNMNGKTMHGNCKLCFLKGSQTTLRLIAEKPMIVEWYIKQEKSIQSSGQKKGGGDRFRKDRPSYSELKEIALSQSDFIGFDDTSSDCLCTAD
jgi:3'-phosphoadenosine 5'-phosphosulfate sulfotransferase (PAPS reductase)/FAD synthetase